MNPEERQKAKEIFLTARELPDDQRAGFIASACGNDAELRGRVEEMIRDDLEAERAAFLQEPAPAIGRMMALGDTVEVREGRLANDPDLPDQGHIGPYHVLEKIGEGGMGIVYLAEQESPMRRRVAIKIIKLGMDTHEVVARFQAERQALAMMDHPNIAAVFDAGSTESGRPYFVMEHVPGVSLTEYCDIHRLDVRERLDLFMTVCHAIHHAHQKGIIHRDIKPTNVLVAVMDGKPVPKVIDFGVAKAINQRLTEQTIFTEQGRLIGTPEYMSPEQAEMTGLNVDTTTDIYSLGVLLYELLTGALPFEHREILEAGLAGMHRMIRETDPPRPSTRISTLGEKAREIAQHRKTAPPALQRLVRGELDWITMRAMEKDRTRRYPSASELAGDVLRYLNGEVVLAGPPSATYRLRKTIRKHKHFVTSMAVVFVALAAGVVVSTTMYVRAENARDRAEKEAQKAERINDFLQKMLSAVDPAKMGREATVRQVLDEAARLVETNLADQVEVQAAVRSTIGNTYMALGDYVEAEPQLRTSLAAREALGGNKNPEVASSLNDMGALAYHRGDLAAAEPFFRRAVSLDSTLLGTRDPRYATSLNNLALLLKEQGRFAEAESTCRRALAIRRECLGANDPDVALSINNLATLLQAQGKLADAEPLMREALQMNRTIYRSNHPAIASGLNNLGALLQAQGKYAEAEPYFREALDQTKALYGEKHSDVASAMSNLAIVLDYQGRYSEAEPLYRGALEMYESTIGDRTPEVATALNNLGILLQNTGRISEAEAMQRQALALRRKILGDRHPAVASSLSNLALVLQDRGKLVEAEPLYREALDIRRSKLGNEHPLVASSLLGLGSLLVDMGKAPEAEPLLRECQRIRLQKQSLDSWTVAYAQNVLGHCLSVQGRYVEAESLLTRGLPIIEASTALSAKRKRGAIQHVIHLYEAWGKPAEAASFRAELSKFPDAFQTK